MHDSQSSSLLHISQHIIFTGLYAAVMQHFCLMTVFLAVMVAVVVMEVLASVTFFALNNDPSVHSNTNAMLKKTLQR